MDDESDGFVGFVHQAVIDNCMNHHDAGEDIEFYFCGPPLMNAAVLKMVDDFGVPRRTLVLTTSVVNPKDLFSKPLRQGLFFLSHEIHPFYSYCDRNTDFL